MEFNIPVKKIEFGWEGKTTNLNLQILYHNKI